MTTLSATHPTLLDLARRQDPNGKIANIVEVLNQTNEILDDAVWLVGNLETGNKTTVRTGIPSPTWRKLYGSVQPTKSRTANIIDTCGMLESYAEVDKALADLNGNTAEFRMSEELAFIEGMNQEFAQTLFYGNEATEPEAFTGLSARYNSKTAENARNLITSAASPDSSDNTSIWLIVWGPNTVNCIIPKGSRAGLQITDKGQVTKESSDGMFEAYRTHYRWDVGLSVRDWRYAVRIQIDQEDLTKSAGSGPDLLDLMAMATHRIPNLRAGRAAFYANTTVTEYLDRQSMNRGTFSVNTVEDVQGRWIQRFRGIPVRRCDALTNTEAAVS